MPHKKFPYSEFPSIGSGLSLNDKSGLVRALILVHFLHFPATEK